MNRCNNDKDLSQSKEINVLDLIQLDINEEQDVVENLLPIGVSVIGAPQKIGKTFFCLQLAISVSTGQSFLNKNVQQGTVLYIALEDPKAKIRKRIKRFNCKLNSQLDIRFENAYDPFFDLESIIKEKKDKSPHLNLIIIDTFAKIRKNQKTEYDLEYEEVSKMHELGMKYHVCILLVTHVKKTIDFNNPFDSIYGSRGITAAVDSMMVIFRKSLNLKIKELHITGKDIPDDQLVLIQDERMLFSIVDDEEIDEDIDENLIRVIHYLVAKKEFYGTHLDLCSKLNLSISAKKLQCLLKVNKTILEDNFITYEKGQKTTKARPIKMIYHGNEEL